MKPKRKLPQKVALGIYDKLREAHGLIKDIYFDDNLPLGMARPIQRVNDNLYLAEAAIIELMEHY